VVNSTKHVQSKRHHIHRLGGASRKRVDGVNRIAERFARLDEGLRPNSC
jgi:hypothetical protein